MTGRTRDDAGWLNQFENSEDVFECLGIPTVVVDEYQAIIRLNRAFEQLLGISRDELYGQKWTDLVVPEEDAFQEAASIEGAVFFLPESYRASFVDNRGTTHRTIVVKSPFAGPSRNTYSLWSLVAECSVSLPPADISRQYKELNRLFSLVELGKKEWEITMDCVDDMVVFIDEGGAIKRCNKAMADFAGRTYQKLIGERMALLLDDFEVAYGASSSMGVLAYHPKSNLWYRIRVYTPPETRGGVKGTVITLTNVTVLKLAEQRLIRANQNIKASRTELEKAYNELKTTQAKILQHEKMASIGMLAAGVAHEINNPTSFIISNLGTLEKYCDRLVRYVRAQEEALAASSVQASQLDKLRQLRADLKIDLISDDTPSLIRESIEGSHRVKAIVQDLKSFSRSDEKEYKVADINQCLESTINMVWNEIKYKGTVEKDLGEIPPILCFPQRLNQVFMNLLVNAAQAIDMGGKILVRTRTWEGRIEIVIADDGCGLSKENLKKIFEPFFTTKQVGQGTGLGLSISYDIIKKHQGNIQVESEEGQGTVFTITLPIVQEGKPSAE